MPYIDLTYYNDDYKGEPVDSSEFDKLEQRASEMVDALTHYKVAQQGLESLNEFQTDLFKKAVASQVEFYVVKEDVSGINAGEDFSNFTIGNFSLSKGGRSQNIQADRVSPSTLSFLQGTGLLYTGVGVMRGY